MEAAKQLAALSDAAIAHARRENGYGYGTAQAQIGGFQITAHVVPTNHRNGRKPATRIDWKLDGKVVGVAKLRAALGAT